MGGLQERLNKVGEVELAAGDAVLGGACLHPRSPSDWMAWWKPRHTRDSGLKRYRTRAGALARARKEATAMLCELCQQHRPLRNAHEDAPYTVPPLMLCEACIEQQVERQSGAYEGCE